MLGREGTIYEDKRQSRNPRSCSNKRVEIYDIRLDIYDRYFNFKNEAVSASSKVDRGYATKGLTYILEQMSFILQVIKRK